MQLQDRKRKMDLNKLSHEDAKQISEQVGNKVREMVDKTVIEVNRLLEVFGLEAKMQLVFDTLEVEEEEKPAKSNTATKKPRKSKKTSNLKIKPTPHK